MGVVMKGYESLARAVIDGGARVAASYPGGPATGVVETLIEEAAGGGLYVEWSSSEKVAFEVALGASTAGVRAVMVAKHVGINHIIDPLMTANLTGVGGGLVILAGDDPGSYNSQNEQDCRPLAAWAEIPILEPATPQEGYDMVRAAFELSERFRTAVMVRFVADYAAASGPVTTAPPTPPAEALFDEPDRYKCLPAEVVGLHAGLHQKLAAVGRAFAEPPLSDFNRIDGSGRRGIIAAGRLSAGLEALIEPGSIRVLKLGTLFPPPEELIARFLSDLEVVYVLEEVEPFIEDRVRIVAHKAGLKIEVRGKTTGHAPWEGDFNSGKLVGFLTEELGLDIEAEAGPARKFPSLQPLGRGCPYRPFFAALKKIVEEKGLERPIVVGETGCLVRLNNPPLKMLDIKFSMGSAVGAACGLRWAGVKGPIVAAMGDSVFFHTGINGVIDAANSQADIVIAVMDNGTVALTGFQERIGSGRTAMGEPGPTILPEKVAQGLGLNYVKAVDAFDASALEETWRECLGRRGPSFVVVRGECPYIETKRCQVGPEEGD